jgi:tripartite-type tricarboxylate transporter receptor subunit TctC
MHAFAMSATVIALSSAPAFAQTYPTQDLHFICAYPAGSGADIFVRFYAEKLRPVIGRTIIVENKPGAVSNIATEYVARAKPDGYTVYIQGASSIAANMHLFKNPPVDVGRAIQIAAPLNKQPYMLVVDASRPWKNVAELAGYLKDRKDKASYATTNPPAKVMGATRRAQDCRRSRCHIGPRSTPSMTCRVVRSTTRCSIQCSPPRRHGRDACAFWR